MRSKSKSRRATRQAQRWKSLSRITSTVPLRPMLTLSRIVLISVSSSITASILSHAFVTFFTLDNESRDFDENGRLIEIGYNAGIVKVRISEYDAALQALAEGQGLVAKLFKLTDKQRAFLKPLSESYRRHSVDLKETEARLKPYEGILLDCFSKMRQTKIESEKAEKADRERSSDETKAALATAMKQSAEAEARFREIQAKVRPIYEVRDQAERRLSEILMTKLPGPDDNITNFLNRSLRHLLQSPDLFDANGEAFAAAIKEANPDRRLAIDAARERFIQMGVATNLKDRAVRMEVYPSWQHRI